MREVVITGLGVVSSLGTGVPEFSRRMFAGDSGLTHIRGRLAPSNFPVPVAAPIPRDTLGQPAILHDCPPEMTHDSSRCAGLATEEAIQNLPEGALIDAIVYGTSEYVDFKVARDSFRAFDPEEFPWADFKGETSLEVIRRIAEAHGHGPINDRDLISISNACVSSNQAIGVAFQRIRSGQWSRALAGAVYARCNLSELMNFCLLHALTTVERPVAAEASRPFSKDRSGFVQGEGAATLVLEDRDLAEARGAPVLGMVTGYAATSDAFKMTDGRPDGKGASKAIEAAIADAGLSKEQIDAISAHGTSTRMNDRLETLAIKNALGPVAYRVPVVSLKSQIGHPLVASGALEAVASLQMLAEQRLAPTLNCRELDPECDLDYVPNESRPAHLKRILSNSFGFGGQNSCVVFEQAPLVIQEPTTPETR
jgi:3-oxoacyl-[acyl-carrier-protein] synthase II